MNLFQHYVNFGLSVIPCKEKRSTLNSWKQYQSRLPTLDEAETFGPVGFHNDIACICGKVSGGLVCIDFDVKNGDKYTEWKEIIQNENPDLFWKLAIETTPSGGFHVIFRSTVDIKNVKLALNKDKKATIETRGEGGYFVCTPSTGYEFIQNYVDKIPTITEEEHDYIISLCKSLSEEALTESFFNANSNTSSGTSVFDEYDAKNTPLELLKQYGWKELYTRNNAIFLQRPDKDGKGISASWNYVPNRLYVFTSSTSFENGKVYKPSAVYSILCHNGNYVEAAKTLSSKGYGSKQPEYESKTVKLRESFTDDELIKIYDHGFETGKSTGFNCLSELYTVSKGEFTVVTGMPSHGKSEFMDQIAVNLAKDSGWKFAMFTPENYPLKYSLIKLSEKYIRKPFRGQGRMTIAEFRMAVDFINRHFFFIDALHEDINLESILSETTKLIASNNIDGLILDPWNEIEYFRSREISDTEFIGNSLRKLRKYARKNNIHLWIVAHPTKMVKDKSGKYPIPELYDIQGSSHWRNKADNGICVYRDYENERTLVFIQKIKFRNIGKQGEATLYYNNGHFIESRNPFLQ